MKKFFFLLLLCIGITPISTKLHAQVADYYEEPKLYLGQVNANGDLMEINYEITTAGYVEIHLIDPKGKKVWIRGQVRNKKGSYAFKIPSGPMEKNARYEFILKFKGKEEKSSFYSPAS